MKSQTMTIFHKICHGIICSWIFCIAMPCYSQITVHGTVTSSVDQSVLENALVTLMKVEIVGLDTARILLHSTLTDRHGHFYFQTTGVVNDHADLPQQFELSGNYPNPFSDETKMDLDIQQSGNFIISIYNILGQMVSKMHKSLGPGRYIISWQGGEIPGVYFAKIQSGDEFRICKLIQLTKKEQSSALSLAGASTTRLLKQRPSDQIVSVGYLQITVNKADFLDYKSPLFELVDQSLDISLIRRINENNARVVLEGQQNHGWVRVTIVEADTCVFSAVDGYFTLPPLRDGVWTICAEYPYYVGQKTIVAMKDGKPIEPIETMTLKQQINFQITPAKESFQIGEDVQFTLVSTNVTDQTVTLWSSSSSMMSFAVRKDGVTLFGGLVPGHAAAIDTRTFQPNAADTCLLQWRTSKEWPPEPGTYDIFAVLVAKEVYVHSDTSEFWNYYAGSLTADTLDQNLKESLFTKLVPATVLISP